MRVESVTVCADRIDAIVRVDDPARLRTSPDAEIAGRVLALLPGLASHRCENNDGLSFAEELSDTEVPHLFEHVVLELMAEAGSPRSLRGETSWDFKRDGRGVFRVSLEYDDDLVCLGAIKAACRVVRHALEGTEAPDIAEEARKLTALRQWDGASGRLDLP